MVKNFLKRTLCIVLSFAMMTGTVMVGAKTKTENIHSKLPYSTYLEIQKEKDKQKQKWREPKETL